MFAPSFGLTRSFFAHNAPRTMARTGQHTWGHFRSHGVGLGSRLNSFATTATRPTPKAGYRFFASATIATVGLGLATLQTQPIMCDSSPTSPGSSPPKTQSTPYEDLPPPPSSSVSAYELGFGTVAGVCAGIFVKKGAKAAAWLLGGIFVLLQYLASQSLVRVDWTRMASRFEDSFHAVDRTGVRRAPTVGSVLRSIIDFLTADFQPRASFIAGFALGLRVG